MQLTRRSLLQGASVLGGAVVAAGAISAFGSTAHADDGDASASAPDGVQYGFLMDISKCVDCRRCVDACRTMNQLSDDTPDRRVITHFVNSKKEEVTLSTSCMHCAKPSCLQVCPAGAITKGAGGIVSVDKDRCIGCKYCYQACPYEVPHYNAVAMDKCDCCLGAGVAAGDTPHCVKACIFDALRYGPLDELLASTDGAAVPIAEPNNPSCLVLGTRG